MSISFEQTQSFSDAGSMSDSGSERTEPETPSQELNLGLSQTSTLSANSPLETPTSGMPPPVSIRGAQDIYPLLSQSQSHSDKSVHAGGDKAQLASSVDQNRAGLSHHAKLPSVSSSCYSSPRLQSSQGFLDVPFESRGSVSSSSANDVVDENAIADEMATMILEKVSAEEYVKDIKTGSWYI